ncbi:MAG: TSUP family transporter [Gemmatimonadaceae bacterium]
MLYLIIGLVAGIAAGIFGIGGGVLIVPALIIFKRMVPARATGTSLAALLLPVGALAAWQYYQRGDVDVGAAAWLALGLASCRRVGRRGVGVASLGAHGPAWVRRLPRCRGRSPMVDRVNLGAAGTVLEPGANPRSADRAIMSTNGPF